MSQARYHVLAALTSAVTLAVGVVVGVGPLSEQQTAKHRSQTQGLRDANAALHQRLGATRTQAAADAAAAKVLSRRVAAGRLDGRTVVVIAAPGAPATLVRRAAATLRRAGATVTGTLSLTDVYVDPSKAQSPLEDLALRLVPPGVEFSDGQSSIQRVGTVLARATVSSADSVPAAIDQKAAEVIAGLDELGAAQLKGDPGRLAELAVLVAGPLPRTGERATGARDALLGLVAALDAGSHGVVVTGGPDSTGAGGLLAQVRGSEATRNPSTVDTAGSFGGDLALVLALAEQANGRAGDYGTGADTDALLPSLSGPSAGG